MANVTRNIDDLIHGIPEAKPINPEEKKVQHLAQKAEVESPKPEAESPKPEEKAQDLSNNVEKEEDSDEKPDVSEKKSPEIADSEENTDEYGNEIPKPRTYTEEEVNKMMRERFNRGAFKNLQQQQQQQPAQPQEQQTYTQADVKNAQAQGFEFNPDSSEAWDVQLGKFIRSTVNQIQHEERQRHEGREQQERVNQEKHKQAEFESKMFQEIPKYKDWPKIVGEQPITDAMMLGVRNLENPASFLYAAAKRAPNELQRIAQIPDAYVQMAEMGRLQERLSKPKQKKSSNAPRALRQDRQDVSDATPPKYSIDHLIAQDASDRYKRR